MKKLYLIFAFLIITKLCFASQQVFSGWTGNATLDATLTEYVALNGSFAPRTPEIAQESLIPTSGTFKELRVVLTVAPGAGKSFVFTMRKNSADQSVTCTIANTDTSCSDMSNSFTVSAGDAVSIEVTPSGTPTVSIARISTKFDGDNPAESIITGRTTGNINISTYGSLLSSNFNGNGTEFYSEFIAPINGVLSDLYVETIAAPGAGDSYAYTVRQNGANTSLACTISGGSATTCNDTSNTVTVTAGETYSLGIVESGTAADIEMIWGAIFTADNQGEFIAGVSNTGDAASNLDNTQTTYLTFDFFEANGSTDETQRYFGSSQMYIQKMYVELDIAPGGVGKTWDFTLRVNGSNTALTCQIENAETTCNSSGNIAIEKDDILTYEAVPTNTPAATGADITAGAFIRRRFI